MASSSCFTAYPLDETASTASSDSDNADVVDPGGLPGGMRSFLGQVHGSASLKKNTDLVYYRSTLSIKIFFQGYKLDEGHVSDICRHASKLVRVSGGVRLLK